MQSRQNSVIKSLVWRIIGIFIYATIFFLFTGKWAITIASTLVHHTTFFLVYFLHERFWIALKRPNSKLKAWTYEVLLGMGLGGLIVYFFTGTWKAVTEITLTYTVVKILTYYIFDHFWNASKLSKR